MSKFDLKKIFSLDAPVSPVSTTLPESELMDEVLITGLPLKFPAEQLATILCQDCSERGMALPALIWQSGPTEYDDLAMLIVLEKPVVREVMTESLMECIEDIMDDMKVDIMEQAYSLEPAVNHGFDGAVEYIKRNYPGPYPGSP